MYTVSCRLLLGFERQRGVQSLRFCTLRFSHAHVCSVGFCQRSRMYMCDTLRARAQGLFSNLTDQQSCSTCLPGFYTDTAGLTVCDSCKAGLYASANASGVCVTCGPVSFTS
jgi:hypothetical protein